MSSVLHSPSELVPKSLNAQNSAAAKLLMNWVSMASPVLKIQAASQDFQPSTPSSKSHWPAFISLLQYLGACWPDKSREAGWIDFGHLVQRPKPSMGRNSCGHFARVTTKPLPDKTDWFRGYKSWGCKMPKIPWPPKQLPLSIETTGVYGKYTVPFLCGLAKKLVDVSGNPQGAPVPPPASVPGCGQGKRC